MTKLLHKTLSYHHYKEDFYHVFFTGIFATKYYREKFFIILIFLRIFVII